MSATVLYMSMSLDGYVAGPNERLDNGLGDGGTRLHDWFFADKDEFGKLSGINGTVAAEAMATGAVVTGRRTFELGGSWGGDHHDGVPIFVFTRREPDRDAEKKWPLVRYVTDIAAAMAGAKRAAGEKNVLVHGIGTARLALAAGALDEIEIHLVPVLLGQGRRLFPERDAAHIELERTRIIEGEAGVTHLHYRVRR